MGFVARQQSLGFADVRLVDRHEALSIAPGLGAQVLAGASTHLPGRADPARHAGLRRCRAAPGRALLD